MEVSGLFSVTPRGGETILYVARADIARVQALQWDAAAGVTDTARYDTRPLVGREKREKHIPFVRVYGECAEGTLCTALLTLRMENSRNLNYIVRGMFDRGRGVLFYQEFPTAATLCRECYGILSAITGLNVEVREVEIGYVEKA